MPALEIMQFFCLKDNYGVIIHDRMNGVTASIDAPDAARVEQELNRANLTLTHIFTTHHHYDHVMGLEALKRTTGCRIYGPEKEAAAIPGLDETVKEGSRISFGSFEVEVLETPGHTLGHVSYYIRDAIGRDNGNGPGGVAFTGDTLFSVGCGRVMEGTYAQMYHSLQKIAALPASTAIYCGHEYTKANVAFAVSVEPGNTHLAMRKDAVEAAYRESRPCLPVELSDELLTNPFLRAGSPEIRARLGMNSVPDEAVFEKLRKMKDAA